MQYLSPYNKNYDAAIRAPHYTYILGADNFYYNAKWRRGRWGGGGREEVDMSIVDPIAEEAYVVYTIIVILFNDTFQAKYIKVFYRLW